MIFSELYSAYYNTVAKILKTALDHPLHKDELRKIVEEHAFAESVLNIEPALYDERWQLIKPGGTTVIQNAPSMPLTLIQRRWLKAIFWTREFVYFRTSRLIILMLNRSLRRRIIVSLTGIWMEIIMRMKLTGQISD